MNDEPGIRVSDWSRYFKSIGLREDLVKSYERYIRKCHRRSIPVIFEFRHLSQLLGRTRAYLASAVAAPEKHYRRFTIPKKAGGEREIHAPYPALLECQQWICKHVASRMPVHVAATGYRKGVTIKENVFPHLSATVVLKIDIQDFFPSIGFRRVMSSFRLLGYPRRICYFLAKLCCVNGSLPQGGATSPQLSNAVCWKLDTRLSALAAQYNLAYTRYADDMVFSGHDVPIWFIPCVRRILRTEGFLVNEKKTRLWRGNQRKIITGLHLIDGVARVPRETRRKLRQAAHFVLKWGILSHAAKVRSRDPYLLESLIGSFQYWMWVEPDDAYAKETLQGLLAIQEKIGQLDHGE